MARVEQTGVAMRLLIDDDICKRDGMRARRRVHGLISLCSMHSKDESPLDEAAQGGARVA
jgi:hypothetical protein